MMINIASNLLSVIQGQRVKCCPSEVIGNTVNDPLLASKYRASFPASRAEPVKISALAKAVDGLFYGDEKRYAFKKLGSDKLYLEVFDSKSSATPIRMAIVKETGIVFTDTIAYLELFIGVLAYALIISKVEEIQDAFERCRKSFLSGRYVQRTDLAKLCDSFYYGVGCELKEYSYDRVTDSEVYGAIRAEGLTPVTGFFYGLNGVINPSSTRQERKVEVKKEETSNTGMDALIKDCLEGKYHVDYKWRENQASNIQETGILESYLPNETFMYMLKKIKYRTDRVLERMAGLDLENGLNRVKAIGEDYINVTLSGEPGTGKTKLAYALAAATGMPIYSVPCSHNTDEDQFQGMTKMVAGKPQSVPTNAVKCFEEGGILLLEEINLPQAAVVMGALGQATEFPFILKKDGYIEIRRHPLCIFISTML